MHANRRKAGYLTYNHGLGVETIHCIERMLLRLRNLILSVALIAAAVASWLLRPPEETAGPIPVTAASERQFYILDAVFSGLDADGNVAYRLAAARIEGTEGSQQMRFHDVEINYAPNHAIPWQITAQTARRLADQNMLELTDVVIESTSASPEEATRIEAEMLELEPDLQVASSSGPVRFAIGNNRIDAVGVNVDLRSERIRLESRVSGRVAP
jgi:LPS export ABC transporter protein LptC